VDTDTDLSVGHKWLHSCIHNYKNTASHIDQQDNLNLGVKYLCYCLLWRKKIATHCIHTWSHKIHQGSRSNQLFGHTGHHCDICTQVYSWDRRNLVRILIEVYNVIKASHQQINESLKFPIQLFPHLVHTRIQSSLPSNDKLRWSGHICLRSGTCTFQCILRQMCFRDKWFRSGRLENLPGIDDTPPMTGHIRHRSCIDTLGNTRHQIWIFN